MVDEKTCNSCRYCELPAAEEPCYSCLYGKEHPNFEPMEVKPDPVKKAKIVSRLSSWEYTIGYVQGILVKSDIKDTFATESLEELATEIEGFVLDVLNDMG